MLACMDPIENSKPLNENQLRFVAEYLSQLPYNGTAAYMRAYPAASYDTACTHAAQMLKDPRVRLLVDASTAQVHEKLEMEAIDVHREICLIATADPRELTEHYIGACRYCYGVEHKFQRTPAEFAADLARHIKDRDLDKNPDPLGIEFNVQGGIGFTNRKAPHADCPECFGNGVGYEIFKDTRHLSPGAARLYAGVKRTKDGIEIKTIDRAKMVELAGQTMGLFKTKNELSGPNGAPLAAITFTTTDPIEAARAYQDMIAGS